MSLTQSRYLTLSHRQDLNSDLADGKVKALTFMLPFIYCNQLTSAYLAHSLILLLAPSPNPIPILPGVWLRSPLALYPEQEPGVVTACSLCTPSGHIADTHALSQKILMDCKQAQQQ